MATLELEYALKSVNSLSAPTKYIGPDTIAPNYPDYESETVFGTVLLPKIYGKNLDQFEIATDGKIVLSVQNTESLYIDTEANGTFSNLVFEASNQSLEFKPNDSNATVKVGHHTWTSSNNYQVLETTDSSGYRTFDPFTFENDVTFKGGTFGISADQQVTIDTSNLMLDGTLTVESNVEFNSNLLVLGTTTLNQTLSVGEATTLNNTLSVGQATTLASTLDVTDATTLLSTLSVVGVTTLNNTLSVGQATTLNNTLSVGEATTLASTLDVTGVTTLASTLSVTDATTLLSTLSVGEATTLNKTLSVGEATTLLSTLSVGQATTLNNTLSVVGATTLLSTLSVGQATTLNNTLDVTGVTTLLSSLSVGGANTTLEYNLSVGGDIVVSGDLDIKGKINSISTTATDLLIEDNTITLNSTNIANGDASNLGLIIGGSNNLGSTTGLYFDGLGLDQVTLNEMTEKKLTWNNNNGYDELGIFQLDNTDDKVQNEPFWELLGSPLHLSQNVVDQNGDHAKISFAFRMNAEEELEIVKIVENSGGTEHKRIARFGNSTILAKSS